MDNGNRHKPTAAPASIVPPHNDEKGRPITYKEVPGFPRYRVGDDGSIWTCRKASLSSPEPIGRPMSPAKDKTGHLRVELCNNGTQRQVYVHVLVLEVFVGPCPPGLEGCHFPDRDPANNRLENLSWGTRKVNHSHKIVHGTAQRGITCPASRLSEQQVIEIRRLRSLGVKQQDIADRFGITQASVSSIVLRKQRRHI